jgi:hypothetical protein
MEQVDEAINRLEAVIVEHLKVEKLRITNLGKELKDITAKMSGLSKENETLVAEVETVAEKLTKYNPRPIFEKLMAKTGNVSIDDVSDDRRQDAAEDGSEQTLVPGSEQLIRQEADEAAREFADPAAGPLANPAANPAASQKIRNYSQVLGRARNEEEQEKLINLNEKIRQLDSENRSTKGDSKYQTYMDAREGLLSQLRPLNGGGRKRTRRRKHHSFRRK